MIKDIRKVISHEHFRAIFKEVFEGKPFFESWSEEELLEEFKHFNDEGLVFGSYWGEDCVGLISILQHEPGKYPVHFPDDEKILYLSDVAVLEDYRYNGVGTELMKKVVRYAKKYEYDRIYMRTNKEGSMSKSIAMKLGFTVIEGVEQEVIRKRHDGTVAGDTRIFLELVL